MCFQSYSHHQILERTSEPLGVVFDGPEHGSAFTQTSVDHCVAG